MWKAHACSFQFFQIENVKFFKICSEKGASCHAIYNRTYKILWPLWHANVQKVTENFIKKSSFKSNHIQTWQFYHILMHAFFYKKNCQNMYLNLIMNRHFYNFYTRIIFVPIQKALSSDNYLSYLLASPPKQLAAHLHSKAGRWRRRYVSSIEFSLKLVQKFVSFSGGEGIGEETGRQVGFYFLGFGMYRV